VILPVDDQADSAGFEFKPAEWSAASGALLGQLLGMPSDARLARNLKVVLDLVLKGGTDLCDAVTPQEYACLVEAQRHVVASKVAVHELLNMHERAEAVAIFKDMFIKQIQRRRRYDKAQR
jgi:hypothetical protein